MLVDVVTIFPDYLAPLDLSLLGKARQRGLLEVRVHDLRTWTSDVHRTVDDTPYGGGPGMVMKPEPWGAALDAVLESGGPRTVSPGADSPRTDSPGTDSPWAVSGPDAWPVLVVPTPSGQPFTQSMAAELAREPWLVFACGRYEGIDGRVLADAQERFRVREVSLGDYVLAGGEVAVLAVVEAVARLLPGVLGNAVSHQDDSFAPGPMAGLLEGPVYTRPPVWRGLEVPDVLQSGDHGRISRWRREQAVRRTAKRRPELPGQEPGAMDDVEGRPGGVAE